MKALCFDPEKRVWLDFGDPAKLYTATQPGDIPGMVDRALAEARAKGWYAAGYITYEGARGFDEKLSAHAPDPTLPVARLGLYPSVTPRARLAENDARLPAFSVGKFVPEIGFEEYATRFATVRERLRRGETYQINLTFRLDAPFSGGAYAWFASLAESGHGDYSCYFEDNRFAILSLSPELFFKKTGSLLTFMPMKGTAPYTEGREAACSEALRNCPKNRAENLMIVDMIRNDAGRVAEIGSVEVPVLFETRTYPTLIQMTSTVTARSRAGLPAILEALFPCASITGAPKRSSMAIIKEIESSPRGVYTGAMGFVTPDQDCLFNVAIRTAVVDKTGFTARYGTGSGVTWNSEAASEWEECLLKTAILRDEKPFEVFESLLLRDGVYWLEGRHIERLEASCRRFSLYRAAGELSTAMDAVRASLAETAESNRAGTFKVRVSIDGLGPPTLSCAPVEPLPEPYTITVSAARVSARDPFVAHKTNRRRHIDEALATAHGAADVMLVNDEGELTETSRANLILEIDGKLFTPPLSAGLLPGVYRAELIARGTVVEKALRPADLERATAVYAANSVRGLIRCRPVR